MAFQVRTTKQAEAQIEATYQWLSQSNPTYADQWFRGLMNTIATLQEKPLRCSLARESRTLPEEVRQLLYGKGRHRYRILFVVREETVHVLYVRGTAQDDLTEEDWNRAADE
jgi:plasmid stabilization system protein ParE